MVPNLAVIEEFTKRSRKHSLLYVGAKGGVEREAVERLVRRLQLADGNLEIREISSGKLRRYFSWENFVDVFRVVAGILQAVRIVRKFDPHVVFSKGGFVAVPVVVACGWVNFWRRLWRGRGRGRGRILVVIHESDAVMGLANKISSWFADKVLLSFEKAGARLGRRARGKVEVVGSPVRAEIFKGESEKGLKLGGFNRFKPVVLVMGGSQGARQINNLVWGNLDKLLKKYQIVHIVGKGNLDFGLHREGYKQFELLFDELADVYAACDLVVSRGGANSLAEISALEKKAVVLPLGRHASRGDQIVNAKLCAEEYGWQVLYGDVSGEQFVRAVEVADGEDFKGGRLDQRKATKRIVDLLTS